MGSWAAERGEGCVLGIPYGFFVTLFVEPFGPGGKPSENTCREEVA